MDQMSQVAEHSISRLLDKLIRCHKQLTNTNISIFITTNVIGDMLEHMAELQSFVEKNLDPQGIVAAAVTHAQTTIDVVLHQLRISNPQYASRPSIFRNATLVRSQLISQVMDCMRKARLSELQKKQIKECLKAQLDGTKGNALSARHLPLVRGLLTGKSLTEVVANIQPIEERAKLSELLQNIDYEHLCQVFAPLAEWKSLRGTTNLLRQLNTTVNARRNPFNEGGSRTNRASTTDRGPLNRVSNGGIHESRHMPLRDEELKQSGTDDFTNLVDQRLQLADIDNEQRARMIHSLSCCLANQPFTSQSSAEGIFVMGLLTGQDVGKMFEQCETNEDAHGLFNIVKHLCLDGLRVGRDWVFDENGILVQQAGATLDGELAGLDNIAAIGGESSRRHNVASEEQISLVGSHDEEADVTSFGAEMDEMNVMREAARQLHRELANTIAEGLRPSRTLENPQRHAS